MEGVPGSKVPLLDEGMGDCCVCGETSGGYWRPPLLGGECSERDVSAALGISSVPGQGCPSRDFKGEPVSDLGVTGVLAETPENCVQSLA